MIMQSRYQEMNGYARGLIATRFITNRLMGNEFLTQYINAPLMQDENVFAGNK